MQIYSSITEQKLLNTNKRGQCKRQLRFSAKFAFQNLWLKYGRNQKCQINSLFKNPLILIVSPIFQQHNIS